MSGFHPGPDLSNLADRSVAPILPFASLNRDELARRWSLPAFRAMLGLQEISSMVQSVLLVVVTALATWLVMRWFMAVPRALNREQREIGSAKDIGTRLDGAR